MTVPPDLDGQLTEFHDRGYLVLKGAIQPATVGRIADFIYGHYDRHKELFRERTGKSLDDRRFLTSIASDAAVFSGLPSDLKHLVRGELPLEVRLDATLKLVAHEEGLARVLRALLGAESLRLHNPPSIRVSAPGLSIGNVPLHQDLAYNLHVKEFVTAWVPLCEIDDACGGVDVLEGSHRSSALEHVPQVVWSNAIKDAKIVDRFVRRHVLLGAGDVLLFGPYLLHASHPNSSDRVRASIDYRFFSAATSSEKHYYDVDRRHVVAPPQPNGD
jgi:hypothetical protein